MELKCIKKSIISVDSYDLERYLASKVGRNIEMYGMDNDTTISISLKKENQTSWDEPYVKSFLEKGDLDFQGSYRAVLIYCVNQGWLEEGDYNIEFSW